MLSEPSVIIVTLNPTLNAIAPIMLGLFSLSLNKGSEPEDTEVKCITKVYLSHKSVLERSWDRTEGKGRLKYLTLISPDEFQTPA